MLVGCGGTSNGPTQPTPPSTSAPVIVCPDGSRDPRGRHKRRRRSTSRRQPRPAALPRSQSSAIPSPGSEFRLGSTSVSCSATDAQSRAAVVLVQRDADGLRLERGEVRYVWGQPDRRRDGTSINRPAFPRPAQCVPDEVAGGVRRHLSGSGDRGHQSRTQRGLGRGHRDEAAPVSPNRQTGCRSALDRLQRPDPGVQPRARRIERVRGRN